MSISRPDTNHVPSPTHSDASSLPHRIEQIRHAITAPELARFLDRYGMRLAQLGTILNLVAPLLVSLYAQRVMAAQPGGGSITNVSSLSGVRPSPGSAAYSAAKTAVLRLTESLAGELKTRGINVNCIAPGTIDTDMVRNNPPEAQARMAAACASKLMPSRTWKSVETRW